MAASFSRYRFLTRCWRPIELLISRVIRGWPRIRSRNHHGHPNFGMHLAPCDSLIIGSGPWLCLCCLRLRRRIGGIKRQGPERVVTQHGTYVWGADADPLADALRAALERMKIDN